MQYSISLVLLFGLSLALNAQTKTASVVANAGAQVVDLTDSNGNGVPSFWDAYPRPAGGGASQALNISTRLRVQNGDNILIGGFIATGTGPKRVILRAIGPSMKVNGVPLSGRLSDPTLELRDSNGALVAANDDWKINAQTHQLQEAEVRATTLPPPNDLESAIIATLQPQQGYTALVRGVNGATGVALFEAYDLNPSAGSKLANISTRGFVETGDNIMIGGFILVGSTNENRVIIRAIAPSLNINGVALPGRLVDPALELRDSNGALVAANDNWKVHDQSQQSQEAEVRSTRLPPAHDLESALVVTLPAGAYTALLAGRGGQTGLALVEVYTLR